MTSIGAGGGAVTLYDENGNPFTNDNPIPVDGYVGVRQVGTWTIDSINDGYVTAGQAGPWNVNIFSSSGAQTGTSADPFFTATGQALDSNNSATRTSANGTAEYIGDWTRTRSQGTVRQLVVLASNVSSGLGGTFTFEYSEDGSAATISEARTIGDFATVRDFDLLNAGEWFRIKFTPSRAPVGSEFVAITTTQRASNDGAFVRLANQEIEEANAALTQGFSYIKAFNANTGKSTNIRPSVTGALFVRDEAIDVSQSGSTFVEGMRDDASHIFSKTRGPDEVLALINGGSVNGTVAHDAVEGQLVASVPATAGSTAFFLSEKTVVYEAGHMIRGEQTVQVNTLPTGDGYVEWGLASSNGAGGIDSSIGWRLDVSGLHTVVRKNGAIAQLAAQSDWNRDRCDGYLPSKFLFDQEPQLLNPLKNNIYRENFEWLGIAPPTFHVMSPSSAFIPTHVFETPNQQTGTIVPDPEMRLFIFIANDTTSGGAIQVRSGCWRGGIYTSKITPTAKRPDGDFADWRSQGKHSGNSTAALLSANAIFRGTWFEWQANYVSAVINMTSDVVGTCFLDFSEKAEPVDGYEVSVDDSKAFDYDDPGSLFRNIQPIQSRWVRARYVNGMAAQSVFELEVAFLTSAPAPAISQISDGVDGYSMAAATRAALFAKNEGAETYSPLENTESSNGKKGLNVTIVQVDDDIPLRPISAARTGQVTVGTTPLRLDTGLVGRKSIMLANDGDTIAYFKESSSITDGNGFPLGPGRVVTEMANESIEYWGKAIDGGAATNTQNLVGATGSGTMATPTNLVVSDDVRAIGSAVGQTGRVAGFNLTLTLDEIQRVRIGVEARKASSPTTEQVAWIDTVTGVAGNVGSVVSGTVTSNTAHFYLAAISRKNSSASITSVVGVGLTWNEIHDITGSKGETRLSLWKGSGTPTGNGTVTATFSTTATNSVIGVSRFSNADSAAPIQNSEALNNASITNSYSDSIIGTDRGMAATFVSMGDKTHTAESGFTERHETLQGGGDNAASLATSTLELVGGSQAYSGTFNDTVGWSVIAVALTPRSSINPILAVGYDLPNGTPGATTGTLTISSAADTTQFVDITADRIWVAANFATTEPTLSTSTIGAANVEVDRVYMEVVETEIGGTTRIAVRELA